MTFHCLQFEAQSIQSWIMASGKLREMVGASELVDALCPGRSTEVAKLVDGQDRIEFSRNGGGAFYAFSTDEALLARFASLWSVVVQQHAPGLAFTLVDGQGPTRRQAFLDALSKVHVARSRQSIPYPLATPVTELDPRTGLAAVAVLDERPVDAATQSKRRQERGHTVADLFAGARGTARWPRVMEAGDLPESSDIPVFPFADERRHVAVVHADGNGLGQVLMALGESLGDRDETFIRDFSAFSDALKEATRKAAAEAMEPLLPAAVDAVVPARPLVLGGDDLTVLVRADHALSFTERFLKSFESHTTAAFARLRKELDVALPEKLTACAGIAYVNAKFPFVVAHGVAESLCAEAKRQAKALDAEQIPAGIALHRVHGSVTEDWSEIVESEIAVYDADDNVWLPTCGCYFLNSSDDRPTIGDLRALASVLARPELGRGAARELLTLMGESPTVARAHYERWTLVLRDRGGAAREALTEFDMILGRLLAHGQPCDGLPYTVRGDQRVSPLGSAISLLAVGDSGTNLDG